MQVDDVVMAGRREVAQVRHLGARLVDPVEVKVDPRLVRDGGQMQHGVGGAAQRHIQTERVAERGFCHDLLRGQPLPNQLDDPHAGLFGQTDARRVHGGNRAVPRQRHADDLGDAVHGVRGEHAGAASAARTGGGFHRVELRVVHLARLIRADRLEHGVQIHVAAAAGHAAGHHRAAGDDHGGQVEAARRHQHAGHDLVAVRDEHHAVKAVGNRHRLAAIGDQLAGGEGILHADMPHGDAVAHADGREFDRHAARQTDAVLDGLRDVVQVVVPRHALRLRADHADQRELQLLVGQAERLPEGTMRRLLRAAFHAITDCHLTAPPLSCPSSSCRADPCRLPQAGCPPRCGAWRGSGRSRSGFRAASCGRRCRPESR